MTTAAEKEALRALAEATLVERLERTVVVGHTSTGRVIAEFRGEPGPAETAWFGLCAKAKAEK